MKPALTTRLQTTVLRHLGDPVVVGDEHYMGTLDDQYQVRVVGGQSTEVQEPVLWIHSPQKTAAQLRAHFVGKVVQAAGRRYVIAGLQTAQGDDMLGLRLKQSQG